MSVIQRLSRFTAIYVLWLVSAILALLTAWFLREAMVDLAFVLKANPWQVGAINNFGTVTIGLLWLVFAMGSEGYFRKFLDTGLQARPLATLFAIELVALTLAYMADKLIL